MGTQEVDTGGFQVVSRWSISTPSARWHLCIIHGAARLASHTERLAGAPLYNKRHGAPCITHGAARYALHHTQRVMPGAPLHHTGWGAPCITYVAPCHMHFCITRRTLITPPALQAHICITHDSAPCITHGAARCTLHHTRRILSGAPLNHTQRGAPWITSSAPCRRTFATRTAQRALHHSAPCQAHLCITVPYPYCICTTLVLYCALLYLYSTVLYCACNLLYSNVLYLY
jgi:hypothetical protein